MANDARYEIGQQIASGEFATVYRGRDVRLDRDVAIKQLHQQYLNDPRQTERYWQEAQILARLEHPHVMTIYDVVPERGWLILELMKGSLKDQLGQRPIHLNDLRLTILFAARALSFFQQQKIIHGDVKPSNLLIDRNNVIKLGDFGIARRLQSDDGSAIKGTTRYIAPEVVSDKFGPVGPHSDIYSLGFSAYELLCGERFETLFPGLHMFGRDQQLAWIMWHSAPDRRLPRIGDVLEGVPDRMAAIIEKMTEKEPAKRYQSADQIIADLTSEGATIGGPSPEELAHTEHEALAQKRKRYVSIGAFVVSLLLCLAMLWPQSEQPLPSAPPAPTQGIVGKVAADKHRIYLKSEEIIEIQPNDLILLDNAVCQLDDLEPNDRLSIQYFDGPEGRTKRILVMRGEALEYVNELVSIDSETGTLTLNGDADQRRRFLFDGATPITLNGASAVSTDLKPGDTVDVQYWTDETGHHAVALQALRQLKTDGVVESFDVDDQRLVFAREGSTSTMAVAEDCAITINGRESLAGRTITLADLVSGDRLATLIYDAKIRRMDVQRDLSDVVEVWSVDVEDGRLTALLDGQQLDISIGEAPIRYQDRRVDASFLRKGDQLLVAHKSPDRLDMAAVSIEVADLVRDPRTIAMVICQQRYDHIQITPYIYALRDAQLVRDALDTGARVPPDQLAFFHDLSRDDLLQEIDRFLAAQQQRAQLFVYFVGQAYVDASSDTTYLAARDFRLANMPDTGLRLRDLITRLEQFEAREKLLLLDTCHEVSAVESQSQPATGNQIRKVMIGDAVSRSVIVIGSCDLEPKVAVDDQQKHGQFGLQLARALSQDADVDDDTQVTGDELYRFLREQLAVANQTPVLFPPDTRPPRLTREAADAVRSLLAEVSRLRDSPELESNYQRAQQLCDKQPDAQLAYALIKLRRGRTGESLDAFRAILGAHPNALAAYHAAIYQHLAKKEWVAAAELVERMVNQIVAVGPTSSQYIAELLRFAGTSRGFVAALAGDPLSGQAIDDAAAKLSSDQQALYEEGLSQFRTRYEQTPENQRSSIRRFYRLDFNQIKQYLADQLD
jgi:serine/threonine-protein kinase